MTIGRGGSRGARQEGGLQGSPRRQLTSDCGCLSRASCEHPSPPSPDGTSAGSDTGNWRESTLEVFDPEAVSNPLVHSYSSRPRIPLVDSHRHCGGMGEQPGPLRKAHPAHQPSPTGVASAAGVQTTGFTRPDPSHSPGGSLLPLGRDGPPGRRHGSTRGRHAPDGGAPGVHQLDTFSRGGKRPSPPGS